MKVLIGLCSLQTLLIALLLVLVVRGPDGAHQAPSVALAEALDPPPVNAEQAHAQLDEGQLRRIIREELSAMPRTADDDALEEVTDRHHFTSAEDVGKVDQHIDYYRSAGAISDAEMETLQTEIARLAGRDRARMMSKLVTEMNAGEIRGKLL